MPFDYFGEFPLSHVQEVQFAEGRLVYLLCVVGEVASWASRKERNLPFQPMAELCPSSEEDLAEPCYAVERMVDSPSLPTEQGSAELSAPCRFFLEGRCRFDARCRNYHPSDGKAHHFEGQKPAAEHAPQPLPPDKKPAMKTAEDVISRLLWDTQVPAERFRIGYLDRFLGIVEQPFNDFSWEDLTSAGPGVLAIPKHRIHYFKYRERIVWDKVSRTDDVFGSTGSGRTILEVMREEEEVAEAIKGKSYTCPSNRDEDEEAEATVWQETARRGGNEDARSSISQPNGTTAQLDNATEESVHDLEFVGDTHDGMEQEEVLSGRYGPPVKEDAVKPEDGPSATEASREQLGFPRPKCRPTHFVAVPVTSPEVRKAVKRVQEALCAVQPDLAQFCVPSTSLHLTLGLMRLNTPDEICKAVVMLQELQADTRRLLPPASLISFCSVESFHSRVLYLAPTPSPELGSLAQTLENAFSKKGLTVLQSRYQRKFHLTVVKIPRSRAGPQLPTNSSWIPTVEDLGTQVVEALCLYETGKDRTDGAYATVLKLQLY